MSTKSRVSYFYKQDLGNYYYGPGHPMKPHRLRLTHHLLLNYGLYRELEVLRPRDASGDDMERFHAHDYVEFLKRVTPKTEQEFEKQMGKFNIGPYSDCPIFDGLYDFMSTCAGGSIDAATRINHGLADICVNWSGGLHHAKKGEASGFCYINDIVLSILELLKYHKRVLYIDIDIHHGDGVEEAFYTTDRVMTASFHKYGNFFPGSGAFNDIGTKEGKCCSVNFPLKDGLDDHSFESIFKPVIEKIMQVYQPGAVVMCCGADSITGDRLGCWNMTLRGHGSAIQYVKSFNLPVILLGGGGYTPRNVARCWTYETALALGKHNDLDETIPINEYYNHFGPNHQLHLTPDIKMENMNTRPYLEKYTNLILENLNQLGGPPSVPFQDVPADFYSQDQLTKRHEDIDPDKRPDTLDKRDHPAEFYRDEKDNDVPENTIKIEHPMVPPPAPAPLSLEALDLSTDENPAEQSKTEDKTPNTGYKEGTACGGFVPETTEETPIVQEAVPSMKETDTLQPSIDIIPESSNEADQPASNPDL